MYENMKTYCFGRYLVDIPVKAELVKGYNKYLGSEVKYKKMEWKEFQEILDKRITKLKSGNAKDDAELEKEIKIDEYSTVLISREDVFGDMQYHIDAFKFYRGHSFMISKDLYSEKSRDIGINNFTKFVRAVRYRREREIPTEPGICLENGFIANGENAGIWEQAGLRFKLKDNPDVIVHVGSSANIGRLQPSLLERINAGQNFIKSFKGLKTVRSGKREVNGIPGEEILWQGRSDDKTGPAHAFQWEAQGEVDNPNKPSLHLTLETGQGVFGVTGVSSMQTPELVRIFDAIVKTIRVHPVEEPKPKPEAKTPDAFPRRLATGETCPREGRWRCVEDGRTQRMNKGQTVPEAPFYKPATGLLDRLRGIKLEYSHMGPGHWEWAGETPVADGKQA
jgi:hypothetical protein